MAAIPALIKAYLRLGGFVGDGAWIDHAFNTTDVCLVMDTGADERPGTATSTSASGARRMSDWTDGADDGPAAIGAAGWLRVVWRGRRAGRW